MILEHIPSGMYGAVIAEPREGHPTKVDREYLVIQSEFYAKPDADGRKVDGAPLYVLDSERLKAAQPTHTVFNGVHNGMVKKPLPVKPGERVRLFVLNVGPSKTSSFHVVGTIFDRVWIDGNPDNQMRGMQTVLLGSSNSAIVEMIIPKAGSYIMVDHHFANASQGAIGLISTEEKPKESELEHHNMEATATPKDAGTAAAKLAFESKCLACHSIGQGKKLGPDLAGVTGRRTDAWLAQWLKSPDKMLQTDAAAKAMLKEYNNIPMPNQGLSDAEIKQYISYFHWVDAQAMKPRRAPANESLRHPSCARPMGGAGRHCSHRLRLLRRRPHRRGVRPCPASTHAGQQTPDDLFCVGRPHHPQRGNAPENARAGRGHSRRGQRQHTRIHGAGSAGCRV